ncbi:hypothetical protein [Haematobacter genomosp. 1]|uniref:hypothetical protein n=1 Tax=Haematobacter genomosp. 1 TaxID=366618 RepID=UPI0015C5B775|nr:hypothetical protein [Haematobacter genomosp. 1]
MTEVPDWFAAAIAEVLSPLETRLERIEATLANRRAVPPERDLLQLLQHQTGADWFTAAEVMRDGSPELLNALDQLAIGSARALGKWLRRNEGRGVERGSEERSGWQWRVAGFAPEIRLPRGAEDPHLRFFVQRKTRG